MCIYKMPSVKQGLKNTQNSHWNDWMLKCDQHDRSRSSTDKCGTVQFQSHFIKVPILSSFIHFHEFFFPLKNILFFSFSNFTARKLKRMCTCIVKTIRILIVNHGCFKTITPQKYVTPFHIYSLFATICKWRCCSYCPP